MEIDIVCITHPATGEGSLHFLQPGVLSDDPTYAEFVNIFPGYEIGYGLSLLGRVKLDPNRRIMGNMIY